MPTSPINAIVTPSATDSPNGPAQMQTIVNQIDTRMNARFSTVAARNAAITSPVDGMECFVAGSKQIYYSGSWHGVMSSPFQQVTASTTTFTATADVMSITVPDPGFPYQLDCSAQVLLAALGPGVTVAGRVQVNGTNLNPQGEDVVNSGASNLGDVLVRTGVGVSTVRTGGCVVTLNILKRSGPAGNGYQCSSTSVFHMLRAVLVPV